MKTAQKIKSGEKGQAMVEFALVLPVFLLLVCGILDFGWLFYNCISAENSARNAARTACVEYTKVCFDEAEKQPVKKTFTYDDIDEQATTVQENDILYSVKNTLPGSVKNVKIDISYTYDSSEDAFVNGFEVENRYKGDVTVMVTYDMKVLTPVLGVTCDNMTKTMTSSSTFKVERIDNENK